MPGQNGQFFSKVPKEPDLPTKHKSSSTLKNFKFLIRQTCLILSWMKMSPNSTRFGRNLFSKRQHLIPVHQRLVYKNLIENF